MKTHKIKAKTATELKQKVVKIIGGALDGGFYLVHPDWWMEGVPTYKIDNQEEFTGWYFLWIDCPKTKSGKFIVQ